ncbi:hypothetical protein [Desulforhopalus sp. 52FAK]
MELYCLAQAAGQAKTTFVDGSKYPLYTLLFYDLRALEDLHAIIRIEPVKERDKVMMGMPETIGISPSKPFFH